MGTPFTRMGHQIRPFGTGCVFALLEVATQQRFDFVAFGVEHNLAAAYATGQNAYPHYMIDWLVDPKEPPSTLLRTEHAATVISSDETPFSYLLGPATTDKSARF